MKDITDLFEKYRESTRSIWNQFIFPLEDKEDWKYDSNIEQFQVVEDKLLEIMVLNQIDPGKKYKDPQDDFLPNLRGEAVFGPKGCAGLWAIREGNNWNWNNVHFEPNTEIALRYISFFDWSMFHLKDNRFYRFRVIECPGHEKLVGGDLLLEPLGVRLFYDENA